MKNLSKISNRAKILIPVIFISLVLGVFLGQDLIIRITQPPIKVEEPQKVSPEIKVDLILNFGGGNIKTFKTELKENNSVFDLLKKVTEENNLEFSFKEYPEMGVFIESINNIKNDPQKNLWWQYWVNEEYVKVGASDFILKNGDLAEWKYIEGQF